MANTFQEVNSRDFYRSHMTIEGEPQAAADEIRRILSWSREWNRRAGITGALLFDLRQFAQVLGGPPEAAKNLFGHISCDKRHKDVTLLERGSVPSREFPTWSMAYCEGSVEAEDQRTGQPSRKGESQGEAVLSLLRFLLSGQRPQ
jgi:hypothetical protein